MKTRSQILWIIPALVLFAVTIPFLNHVSNESALTSLQLDSNMVLQVTGLLGIGLLLVMLFIWLFGIKRKHQFEAHDFAFNHSLLTSRMILGFGAIAYPLLNYINYLTDDRIVYPHMWFSLLLGVIMGSLVAMSFRFRRIRRVLPKSIIVFYSLILFQVSLITLLNLILPLHVIGLSLVISLASIVIANPVKLITSGTIYVMFVIAIAYYLPQTFIPKVQLIAVLFSSVLISFLISATKQTLNSRLALGSKVMNEMHSAILIIDKQAEVQYVNLGAKKLFGIPRREILGKGWWSFSSIGKRESKSYNEVVEDIMNDPTQTFVSKETSEEGKELYMRWRFQELNKDWIAWIGEDITENFKIDQELQKLSFVAKHSDVGIVLSDKESRVEWINPKFEEITGFSLEEFIGKRPGDLLTGEETDFSKIESTRKVKSVNEGHVIENVNYRKNGEKFWVQVVSSPILDEEGEIDYIVEIVQDITLQKEREERLAFESKTNALLSKIDAILMKQLDWNTSMKTVLSLMRDEFPEINRCAFYEFDGEYVRIHCKEVDGLPQLSLVDSQAILSVRRHMFGPRLIYNQNENEPWAEAIQDAMNISHNSNFIFYKLTEKSNLLGYFGVSSEENNFIRPEIINIFGQFVEHINLKLLQFLGDARIKSLNKKLHHINELSTAVLNGENVGKKIENLLSDLLGDALVTANVITFDFEQELASYQYSYEGQESTYKNDFSIHEISESALKTLRQNRYFAVEDIRKREGKSGSDQRMIDLGIVSFMMFPLFQDMELFGSLNISMNRPLSQIDQGMDSFLNDLTEELSVSIYQKMLQEQVTKDKKEIEDLHKDIQASVRSAKRIQGSILPDHALFNEMFEDHFILYKPKDVVSGDFYYLNRLDNHFVVAAADCTGHGVPGALVSMVCKSALDKAIKEKKLRDPAKILDQTRKYIAEQFGDSEEISEGMDIALCVFDQDQKLCHFAGAHNPLWLLKEKSKNFVEVKGDKTGVSGFYLGQKFTTHAVPYEKGDKFYLFSDGFQDQFGGDSFKKFGPQRMRDLIKSSFFLEMHEQQKFIDDALIQWQADYDQIDDICMIGFTL